MFETPGDWLVALGGIAEFLGVALVVWDLWAINSAFRDYDETRHRDAFAGAARGEASADAVLRTDKTPTLEERIASLEQAVQDARAEAARADKALRDSVDQDMRETVTQVTESWKADLNALHALIDAIERGIVWRRYLGVGLVMGGIAMATFGGLIQ